MFMSHYATEVCKCPKKCLTLHPIVLLHCQIKFGKAFRNWLEEMTPAGYSVNQQGTVRSSGYWPGSYQE